MLQSLLPSFVAVTTETLVGVRESTVHQTSSLERAYFLFGRSPPTASKQARRWLQRPKVADLYQTRSTTLMHAREVDFLQASSISCGYRGKVSGIWNLTF